MSNAVGISLKGKARFGDKVLFDDLELSLKARQWTCLLGPSGIGKTTILRLLADLAAGVSFTGSIETSDGLPLAGRLAYMAQTDLLMPWLSVMDNVLIGSRLRAKVSDPDKARSLLTKLELADHLDKKPAELSGGQRQRVALARTLMEECPIVLLDEPFSALDARMRSEMQELAAEWLKDATILLVTHDPAEAARLGESIYLMSERGLRAVEPPASPAIRAVDDEAMLVCQGHLLKQLREART
ncbi:MAG: ATP-binding cassette domain-containing protein [Cohaesibacter sp.]|nr:ATP-binding cassette domain-containing protein [Cohaesibacter sp.]